MPSSAPSTARGGWPGTASTQAVALENSPGLRQNFQCPQRAASGSAGSSTASSSSFSASAVVNTPVRTRASGIRRSPAGPSATAFPPNAGSTETQSPAGSACTRLPPTVPRLRTAR